jgi:hypothetical protein
MPSSADLVRKPDSLIPTRCTATISRNRAAEVTLRSYWHIADTGRVRHSSSIVRSILA